MRKLLLTLCFFPYFASMYAQFRICASENITVSCDTTEAPVVRTAIQMLRTDLAKVLDASMTMADAKHSKIVIATAKGKNVSSFLSNKDEAFTLDVTKKGTLRILGSDAHGVAYGILQLSRLLGVSPWEWWADVTPERKTNFQLPVGYHDLQYPSVRFRGIFINDEDWGLMPWSSLTYETWRKPGRIGPKTTARIFELMLHLRANYYWPPMHECTIPFFLTEGNREVAKRYGIYIGGSHCEPMASSTAGEWPRRGKGAYDYVSNKQNVLRFWEQRVKEVAGQDILYTIGMRGVHDGAMNGAKTVEAQRRVLEQVFEDQRQILSTYLKKDATQIPQVFIPYKEVQKVYDAGLRVPDDVTLMWCDDNFGHIRHFPTEAEKKRKGGNGVYYHISYWGGPNDYLWLGTASPWLLYDEMVKAYDEGIQSIWMLNVGDIKPSEYQIELFLDMAWNIKQVRRNGVDDHLKDFLCREFGETEGLRLLPMMTKHYRLAEICKPEHLGSTPENWKHNQYNDISDLHWTDDYIKQRLKDYTAISNGVELISKDIDECRQEAYFQLVQYPVQAACQMNKKMLYAQLGRHGSLPDSLVRRGLDAYQLSVAAYDSIAKLTRIYNTGLHGNMKWNRIMSMEPRNLTVFQPIPRKLTEPKQK